MHQEVKEPIASFVSKMIVAMFWKQLPIQFAVADSVADSNNIKFESATGN